MFPLKLIISQRYSFNFFSLLTVSTILMEVLWLLFQPRIYEVGLVKRLYWYMDNVNTENDVPWLWGPIHVHGSGQMPRYSS
jgi:hypothetical protein